MTEECRKSYDSLLESGIAKEVARLCIPVAQYSKMRASTNLLNWIRFLTLRIASNAQFEIRQYAIELMNQLEGQFPKTISLFKEGIK